MLFLATVISASNGEKLWYEHNQLLLQEEIEDLVFNRPDNKIGGDGRASIGTLSNFGPDILQPPHETGDFFMMRGDIAEIIVYPTVHSSAELGDVFDYLDQRYNSSPGHPCDFSGNGVVDFTDFVMFADAFGQSTEGDNAKFDKSGNGTIDFRDFVVVSNNLGATAAVSVAKPDASLLLLSVCLFTTLSYRRSKKIRCQFRKSRV